MLPELKIYTTLSDLKYILFENPDVISDKIKTNGVWNPHVLEKAELILSNSEPGNVIDIGAGLGAFSVPLALGFYSNFRFFSFEPLRIMYMQLVTNVLLNHLDNIKPLNVGLGEKNEMVEFYTVDYGLNANHGAFSFKDEINQKREILPTEHNELYDFRTLDSYVPKNIRLIKLSAPGMEDEVLNGARQSILDNNLPPIIFEEWKAEWYAENLERIFSILKELGYQEFDSFSGYICAFKDIETKFNLLKKRNISTIGTFTDFEITEKQHDTAETLKSQKPLII